LERNLSARALHKQLNKRRWRNFVDAFCDELQRTNHRQAMLNAGRRMGWAWSGVRNGIVWTTPMKDIQVLRKARKILGQQSVVEYLEYIFDAVGFTPVDGARTLVQHIQGIEYDGFVRDKDGNEQRVTVKAPPSLDALKHYHALTTKKQAQKVEMDTRMLVAHKFVSAEPPKMRSRVLKVTDVDAQLPGS
jgi:hypothetical protein